MGKVNLFNVRVGKVKVGMVKVLLGQSGQGQIVQCQSGQGQSGHGQSGQCVSRSEWAMSLKFGSQVLESPWECEREGDICAVSIHNMKNDLK